MTITNHLPKEPEAVVLFTGLLMAQLDERNNICEIGIHPHKDHVLRLKIELRTHGNHVFEGIIWEHTYPKLKQNLLLNVTDPNPVYLGLARYQQRGRLDRSQAGKILERHANHPLSVPEILPEDFRWALNLSLFHRAGVAFRRSAFQPSIKLRRGFFFATQLFNLGEIPANYALVRKQGPIPDHPAFEEQGIVRDPFNREALVLTAVAQAIGANLYFSRSDGNLALQWEPWQESATSSPPPDPLPILPPPPAGRYYKIIFNNDCRDADGYACSTERYQRGYWTDLPFYYLQEFNLLESVSEDDKLDFAPSRFFFTRAFPCLIVAGEAPET